MSDEKVFPESVIIPLDELMDKLALVPLDVVRKVLATQGLYVIGAAEKHVLDASTAIHEGQLRWLMDECGGSPTGVWARSVLVLRRLIP
jgi:hypothetical protein